jgi:hypothetical protein
MDKIDHLDARITLLRIAREIKANNIAPGEILSYINGMAPSLNPGYAGAEVTWDESGGILSYSVPDYASDDIPGFALK